MSRFPLITVGYIAVTSHRTFPSRTHTHSLQGGVVGFKLNKTRSMLYFSLVKRLNITGYKGPKHDYDNSFRKKSIEWRKLSVEIVFKKKSKHV